MTLVLGVDPGLMTGLAIIEWDGRTPAPEHTPGFWYEEVPFHAMAERIKALMNRGVSLVGIERYIISQRTTKFTRQPEASYVIGWVLGLAQLMGTVEVRQQMMSTAKDAYSNGRLRELGYKIKGDKGHAKDALRHALLSTHKPLGCTSL